MLPSTVNAHQQPEPTGCGVGGCGSHWGAESGAHEPEAGFRFPEAWKCDHQFLVAPTTSSPLTSRYSKNFLLTIHDYTVEEGE